MGGHVQAVTVLPGQAGSARLDDIAEPPPEEGPVLVETLAVGVCGTDLEIANGEYGWAPQGHQRLVLGHESLGRVVQAADGGGPEPGDLVVGIVRQPDPVPCESCAAGEWDMCRNGRYTEHGIKELDGFMRQRYRIDPRYAVKLDPSLARTGVLLEPTGVVAKAWEQVDRIASRAVWRPRVVLVTGAGPIGLLAALLGVQRAWRYTCSTGSPQAPSRSWLLVSGPPTTPARSPMPGPTPTSWWSAPGSASWCSTPWTRWRPTASCA
jgi:threonine dehydrogenase-like Zn-dependent dehydrogenase